MKFLLAAFPYRPCFWLAPAVALALVTACGGNDSDDDGGNDAHAGAGGDDSSGSGGSNSGGSNSGGSNSGGSGLGGDGTGGEDNDPGETPIEPVTGFDDIAVISSSEDGLITDSPRIAFDQTGNAIAVWRQREDLAAIPDIMMSYWNGDSWIEPFAIEADEGDVSAPQLAMDRLGNAWVVWSHQPDAESPDREIRGTRYDLEDDEWSTPATISTTTGKNDTPLIEVDAYGNARLVWIRGKMSGNALLGSELHTRYWFDSSSGWTTTTRLDNATDGYGVSQPHLAVDTSGPGWLLYSQTQSGGTTALKAVFFSGASVNIGATTVHSTVKSIDSSNVAIAGMNGGVFAWAERDPDESNSARVYLKHFNTNTVEVQPTMPVPVGPSQAEAGDVSVLVHSNHVESNLLVSWTGRSPDEAQPSAYAATGTMVSTGEAIDIDAVSTPLEDHDADTVTRSSAHKSHNGDFLLVWNQLLDGLTRPVLATSTWSLNTPVQWTLGSVSPDAEMQSLDLSAAFLARDYGFVIWTQYVDDDPSTTAVHVRLAAPQP